MIAESKLSELETIWIAWQENRPTWIEGLQSDHDSLELLLNEREHALGERREWLPDSHPDKLFKETNDTYESASETEGGAEAYAKETQSRAKKIDRYLRVAVRLRARQEALGPLREENKASFEQIKGLRDKWDAADPNDDGTDSLARELLAGGSIADLAPGRRSLLHAGSVESAHPGSAQDDAVSPADDELVPRKLQPRIHAAHDRRLVYGIVTAFIVYVGAALLGYQQTYLSNPTFGADPLKDYLSLALWMFGADLASRASFSGLAGGATSPGNATPTVLASSTAPTGGPSPAGAAGSSGNAERATAVSSGLPTSPILRRI
jgi:hypothetical protein